MSTPRVYRRKRARYSDDFTNVRGFTDQDQYERVMKKWKINSKLESESHFEYLATIEEQLSSETAVIKAKVNQVHSDLEVNGQKLVDAFQSHSAEYENKLKSNSEKLNKLYEEFCNYRTSHEEIYVDALTKFHEGKRNFDAQLLEIRKKEDELLATINDNIKKVEECAVRCKMVRENTSVIAVLDMAAPAALLEAAAIDASTS